MKMAISVLCQQKHILFSDSTSGLNVCLWCAVESVRGRAFSLGPCSTRAGPVRCPSAALALHPLHFVVLFQLAFLYVC